MEVREENIVFYNQLKSKNGNILLKVENEFQKAMINLNDIETNVEKIKIFSSNGKIKESKLAILIQEEDIKYNYTFGNFNENTRVVLNYKFFKVNPSVLNPIFGVKADSTWDTDQLLVNSYIGR